MINTLVLFLSPEERCQSRHAANDKNIQFDPDLFVQGILTVIAFINHQVKCGNILYSKTFFLFLIRHYSYKFIWQSCIELLYCSINLTAKRLL